jgi:hypothetical protein
MRRITRFLSADRLVVFLSLVLRFTEYDDATAGKAFEYLTG